MITPEVNDSDVTVNIERKHDYLIADFLKVKRGNVFKIKVDNRTGMLQILQRNDNNIVDEIHMDMASFAAVYKVLGLEEILEGNFSLNRKGKDG